ncbi:MAG: HlyD family efflux transporter periplasmic adaptor subunit, partial [Planctomycetes bacterium]|nr:HlyD family efflux transporter periplasmic adaptor subunit [Planctomycetota bacterium]
MVTAIDSAQSKFDQATEDLAKLELGTDSLQRRMLEASAELAQANLNQAQDDLAKLESGVDLLLRQQLEAAVELAQADLASAVEAENNVKTEGNPADVELQRSKLALAVSNLQVKEVYLGGLTTAGASPGEVAAGQKDVDAAQAHLNTTEEALEAIIAGLDPAEVGLKQAAVTLARANLDQAETDLAELLEGPDPVTVALRRHDVAVAQANLAEAEDNLIELVTGPDRLDREFLEASVSSVGTALDEALRLLDRAFLIAPVTGFISLVNVEEGDEVGANAVIVEVVDQTVVEIDGIIDEIDVLLVTEGARATVSMDSLPGRSLDGVVSEIAPAALNQ